MAKDLNYSFEPYVKNKCLFVHIPKTGGISINVSLFGSLGCGHTPIWKFPDYIDNVAFRSYFKFTFVRNPWDRLVSAFFFLKNGGINKMDKKWSKKNLKKFDDFENFVLEWVNDRNVQRYIHFIPQHYFLCVGNNKPMVDFLGYYENIEEDFKLVCSQLGITASLTKLNMANTRRNYKDFYSVETMEIVACVYQKDIEMFGYEFDNSSLAFQLAKRVQV